MSEWVLHSWWDTSIPAHFKNYLFFIRLWWSPTKSCLEYGFSRRSRLTWVVFKGMWAACKLLLWFPLITVEHWACQGALGCSCARGFLPAQSPHQVEPWGGGGVGSGAGGQCTGRCPSSAPAGRRPAPLSANNVTMGASASAASMSRGSRLRAVCESDKGQGCLRWISPQWARKGNRSGDCVTAPARTVAGGALGPHGMALHHSLRFFRVGAVLYRTCAQVKKNAPRSHHNLPLPPPPGADVGRFIHGYF